MYYIIFNDSDLRSGHYLSGRVFNTYAKAADYSRTIAASRFPQIVKVVASTECDKETGNARLVVADPTP